MHLDYPLQQRARHCAEPFQLAFAYRARSVLGEPEDCVVQASGAGLTLLARNEAALEEPVLVLREVFGAGLELCPPEVRLAGEPPQVPIMHLRVDAAQSLGDFVLQVLRYRSVRVLEASRRDGRYVLRGEAPLTHLLGLKAELQQAKQDVAQVWIGLSRYAPSPLDPAPAAA